MRLIIEANKLYGSGDYADAYNLYLAAAWRYKSIDLSFNVRLCKKIMSVTQILGDSIETSQARNYWANAACFNKSRKPVISVVMGGSHHFQSMIECVRQQDVQFDLRFFCATSDGLRPLHDVGLLDLIGADIRPIKSHVFMPETDYCLAPDAQVPMSFSDIAQYLQYKISASSTCPLHLNDVEVFSRFIKQGRVSVIIPTFGRPSNLRRAIQSVLAQDYADIELIVVNDNGANSDLNCETRRVVESFDGDQGNCSIFYYEHESNRNGSAARNTGIINSTGEYICFLDDDDEYLPGRIKSGVDALKHAPDSVGGVYCGYLGWNSMANELSRYPAGNLTREILAMEYEKHYLHTDTVTYRREAILKLNGFDESYRRHQDLEFNLRFFQNYKIGAVEECLVRLNPVLSGVSNKLYDMDLFDMKKKFLRQFLGLIKNYEADEIRRIFEAHWDEIRKNLRDCKSAMPRLREEFMTLMRDAVS